MTIKWDAIRSNFSPCSATPNEVAIPMEDLCVLE